MHRRCRPWHRTPAPTPVAAPVASAASPANPSATDSAMLQYCLARIARLEELTAFIDLLRAHKDWQRCSDIIDTPVYEETQLFRVSFAVKAPKFDCDTRSFDLSTPQNVLLPVDPKSAILVIPHLAASRIQVKLSLGRWKYRPASEKCALLALVVRRKLALVARRKLEFCRWQSNGVPT